jgi:inosine/xanthosine triphosphate pyrophosphatase family protein
MISLQDNKKAFRAVMFVLGISTILLLISSLFILTQEHEDMKQIAGRVIAVDESSVTISNIHGHDTIIYINEDTEISSKNLNLAPGVFIISFGEKDESGKFISNYIRLINKR